jgi:DNA-binding transcriptional regulator YiaG
MSAVTPVTPVTPVTKSGQRCNKTPEQLAIIAKFKRKVPKPSPFKKLRLKLGLSHQACMELLGVSDTTVRRWDKEGSPLIAMRFLHIYDRQDVSGKWGEDWRGWYFSRGFLCGPKRVRFSPRRLTELQAATPDSN